jgi:phenylalanyl-tRNA synthetase beta chain
MRFHRSPEGVPERALPEVRARFAAGGRGRPQNNIRHQQVAAMLLSIQWLREFVPFDGTASALSDRLTMLGLEVEDIRRPFENLKDVLVGHVLECLPHPEADRLSVCRVDTGAGGILDIVCGAPNVARGRKVPVAPVGALLPGGLRIGKATLRGRPSHGMICSERELGLSDAHDGIMVLPSELAVGARLADALALDEEVLDVNVTPNRADCLSVIGLAREAASAFSLPLRLPDCGLPGEGEDASRLVRVEVPDPSLCPLYQGRILEGARIGSSPLRIRCRLHAVGVRAVSGIVDATNYVLMEWGQPLHAFDLDRVEGGRITVSAAEEGESLQTLDGRLRTLKAGDLLIRDAVKPIGLAGVMGGLNSEITNETRRIFLESAIFSPVSIRRTARRLGIHSEASYRFERGVDPEANSAAMDRACALMAEFSGARPLPGVCRARAGERKAARIAFRPRRAEELLGVSLDGHFCRDVLRSLGCRVDEDGDGGTEEKWLICAPPRRHDLSREADVIEELGRVYGLDNIPPELPRMERSAEPPAESGHDFIGRVKNWAAGVGLNEAVNYSFVGHALLDMLRLPERGRISILNPLSAEQGALRNALAPGLLQSLRHNLAQGAQGVRIFETAHVFEADDTSETGIVERDRLGILLHGPRHDCVWPRKEEDADYPDIKGLVEHLCASFRLPRLCCGMSDAPSFLLPCLRLKVHGGEFGFMGRVLPDVAAHFHARKEVWLAELDLALLRRLHVAAPARFAPLPAYPPVRRDITVMGGAVSVGAVIAHIRELAPSFLEDVHLIDIFEQDAASRNLTFRLTFRALDRTLKDAEVDKEREKVAVSLQETFGVRI